MNNKDKSSDKAHSEPLQQAEVSRRFFSDAQDFNEYMQTEKPKEIWLDEFMEDEPYIIIDSYRDGGFVGAYNHQCLLGGYNSDFTWLFESGMYVKTFC